MNRFLLPSRIALLLLCFVSAGPAVSIAQLQVGTAEIDISPTVFPIQLRSGPSNYVHDPLHVRALAFENRTEKPTDSGEGRVVLALVDAIGVGREMTDEAKRLAAEATGWSPDVMLVSGTHTHTAPKGGDTSPGRIAYEERRLEGLTEALITAIQNLEPAQVGFAKDEEPGEVRNRRWYLKEGEMPLNPLGGFDQVKTNANPKSLVRPAGPIDPEVCIIDVRNSRGRALGLLANYSLHYVGNLPFVIEDDGRKVGMASADYFGEFARVMPFRVGGANPPESFVAMMTNGTSGDINNLPFLTQRPNRAPFEQIRFVATKTADAAARAARKIEEYDSNPLIAVRQRLVPLKYRQPSQTEIEKALELLELTSKERNDINSRTTSVANHVIRYSEPEMPESEEILIQAIRIGDQAIVSFPFEVLVEIGLELKEKSPFPHTFTISFANGGYGYLPPPNQHELGGYETWLGTCRFEAESSVILTNHLLEMLEELKAL